MARTKQRMKRKARAGRTLAAFSGRMKKVQVQMPGEMLDEIRNMAKMESRSVSQMIRMRLEQAKPAK
jgi:hypothetical protein